MRVAINLLTENPDHPSGAHWFWTRVIPEMARRLQTGEELHLLVSPKSRHLYQGYGPGVFYLTYPVVKRAALRFARTASTSTHRSGCRSAVSMFSTP